MTEFSHSIVRRSFFLTALLLLVVLVSPGFSQIEILSEKSAPLEAAPLDVAWSPTDSRLFILTGDGDLLVMSPSGQPERRLPVGKNFDRMALDPEANRLFLTNSQDRTLKILDVSDRLSLDTRQSPARGPENAPVEIIVVSDFQCPYCSRLAPVIEQLFNRHPDQIRLVFKNFPLNRHPQAYPAALAALAADRQGKFWPMHDALFANSERLSPEVINSIAQQVGLDMERFQKDRIDPALQMQVQKDISDARAAGVRGTPAVFINGIFARDRSPEALEALINEELARKAPRQ